MLNKSLPLHLNFSWTFAGNGIYAACQWGILIAFTRLGNAQMLGQFTLGLAIAAPVILFANLQLRDIQATDVRQQYQFGDYLGLRLLSTGIALLVIAGIVAIARFPTETAWVILLVSLAKASESFSDVMYGLIQQHEQMDRIAGSLILRGTLALALVIAGISYSGSAVGGVLGLAIAWMIVLMTYDLRSSARLLQCPAQELLPRWRFPVLKKLVKLTLPLGLVMLLISLNTNIPRYLIEGYLGEAALGIFAAIAYLAVAGDMVIGALGQSASPRLARYYTPDRKIAFRNLLLKLLAVGALLGGLALMITLFAGQFILTLLYGSEYAQYHGLFIGLMTAAAIEYTFSLTGEGMTAARQLRVQVFVFGLVTLTSAVSCFLLVPSMGLQGVAIALILAAIVRAVASSGVILYALHRLDRVPVETRFDQ
jgi:O-antigen/teichoic acid export membrane protein